VERMQKVVKNKGWHHLTVIKPGQLESEEKARKNAEEEAQRLRQELVPTHFTPLALPYALYPTLLALSLSLSLSLSHPLPFPPAPCLVLLYVLYISPTLSSALLFSFHFC
jgi:hypothetical protein